MTLSMEYYRSQAEFHGFEEAIKEAWKDGFDEGCKSLIFRAGDEVLDKTNMDYGVVINDESCPWIRVLYPDGSVPSYDREEADRFIEKTGNSYSEIPILREKLKNSNGREF